MQLGGGTVHGRQAAGVHVFRHGPVIAWTSRSRMPHPMDGRSCLAGGVAALHAGDGVPPARHGNEPGLQVRHHRHAGLAEKGVTLAEQGAKVDGRAGQVRRRPQQQGGQAGMERQARHGAAKTGDVSRIVQGLQALEQGDRLLPSRARRCLEPAQLRRVAHPPQGHFQGQAGEVGLEDFRGTVRGAADLPRRGPEPVADSGSQPSGAAGALVSGGQGDGYGDQAGQAAGGGEAGLAGQATVHHRADAGDSETGLGQIRRQYDPAGGILGCRWPPQDPFLFRQGQGAVEGEDLDPGVRLPGHGPVGGQPGAELVDLPGAGQEGEDILWLLGQGLADGGGHDRQPVRSRVAVGIVDLNRVAAAGGLDEGGATQEVRQGAGVQGGGQGQEAQVGAQAGDHVQGEGQA